MVGVFLDRETMGPEDLDFGRLEAALPKWRWYEATTPSQLPDHLAGAEVVVVNKVQLDANILRAAPTMRLLCIAATGTNNVDLDAAAALGLSVCNVRGYGTDSVAQHVFALMLALSTRLIEYRQAVNEGSWQASSTFCLLDYPIRELAGKTIGIVGFGEIGRAVSDLARAFHMRVLIARRPGGPAQTGRLPLHELLPRVDVLTLHCPLTATTRGLIGTRELALMRSDAILINTARGGIVDEPALATALKHQLLGGAGVDVLSIEPPAQGNPLLDGAVPNLIVTPHVAWASREARQRIIEEVALNIEAFLAGEQRNFV